LAAGIGVVTVSSTSVSRRSETLSLFLPVGCCGRSSGHIKTQPWQIGVGSDLGLDASVQLIVRVGYRDPYPGPVIPRLPLSAYIRA